MADSLKLPLAALIGGNAADIGSTAAVLHGGKGHESNPLLPDNPWAIGATKAGITAAEALAMKFLKDQGHPKIAKMLGYGGGAVGALAAIHNFRELSKR